MTLSRRQFITLPLAMLVLPPALAQRTNEATLLTRAIPSTGERLPAVGLGTAIVFDSDDAETRGRATDVLQALAAGGGRLVDTASTYGDAETVLGAVIAAAKSRDRFFVATKVEALDIDEFRRSLARLRVPSVDLLQLHNVRDARQSLVQFRDWKAQGLCRYVGVTSTFPRDFPAMEAVIKREKPDFVELNYSLGDREVEARLLPACAEAGSAVLTALPFGRNSLFRAVGGKALPEWAKDFDAASWGQFFLKYLIGNPAVTAVIPGTTKAEHMDDNLAAGRGRLPDDAQRRKMVQFFES